MSIPKPLIPVCECNVYNAYLRKKQSGLKWITPDELYLSLDDDQAIPYDDYIEILESLIEKYAIEKATSTADASDPNKLGYWIVLNK